MTHAEVIHGDCLEVMRGMPSSSVDMILCDLPYGTTACKWDQVIPFEPLWAEYRRLIKPNGAIVLTASQPFTSALVMSNARAFKHAWVWNKRFAGNFLTAKFAPMKIHEDVIVFSFGSVPYAPLMVERDIPIKLGGNKCASESVRMKSRREGFQREYTHKYPESILFHPRERGLHPTQKPVALFEYLIKTYTLPGQTVLDNAAGSGTTGVAALRCGRNAILIEKDAGYVQVIRDRLRAAQPALLETA